MQRVPLLNPHLAMSVRSSPLTVCWVPGHTNRCWVKTSVTPCWVSNWKSHCPQLSAWGSPVIRICPEFPALCTWTGCHFALTGGRLVPSQIARRISDPCDVLFVPWFCLRQKIGQLDSVHAGLGLWAFPVPSRSWNSVSVSILKIVP